MLEIKIKEFAKQRWIWLTLLITYFLLIIPVLILNLRKPNSATISAYVIRSITVFQILICVTGLFIYLLHCIKQISHPKIILRHLAVIAILIFQLAISLLLLWVANHVKLY
jgi:hypothetical protein